jgi:hypothetical protein
MHSQFRTPFSLLQLLLLWNTTTTTELYYHTFTMIAFFPTFNSRTTPPDQNGVDEVRIVDFIDVFLPEPPHFRDGDDDDNDNDVAGQDDDDELVEEDPVAPPPASTAAPPLRRSKRVAAQRRVALRSGVAPSPYATSGGLRRSARLAGLPRVNYKC